MADQKLNRLKLLMKDREFDWPSQEQLEANRREKSRTESSIPSISSSQANKEVESTSYSLKPEASNPVAHPLPISSVTTSSESKPQSTMPKKRQSPQKGRQPLDKVAMGTSGKSVATGRQLGDMAEVNVSFCPIMAVSKYPYRFMSSQGPANKMLADQVSKELFAGGKFWQRQWSVYYIYPPSSVSSKPLLVVPASEVSTLLQEITDLTNKKYDFPSGHDRGFLIEFPDDGSPRPRYLGLCASKDSFDAMDAQVPPRDPEDNIPNRSLDAFKTKIEAGLRATKNKSTAAKAKKKEGRINQKRGWCSQLRRTQRYLGLRPPRVPMDDSDQGVDQLASREDQHAASVIFQAGVTSRLPIINVDDFAPYAFEDSVVFISLDVECYERSPKQVTEIGISTLDTKDIEHLSPGPGARAWMSRIKSRHFRIKEYQHLTNTDFVDGCPDRFEKAFGASEFISLAEAPKVLASCFRPPFGYYDARNMPMGPLTLHEQHCKGWGMDISDAQGIFLTDDPRKRPRKLVLVGHDVSHDIVYLQSLGYDPSGLNSLVEILDTGNLYQAWKQEEQLKNLGSVLVELGIAGWNLHNAGNDAAYTLQALLALSLAALNTFSSTENEKARREAKIEAAKKEAEERLKSSFEEWDAAKSGEVQPDLEEQFKDLELRGKPRKSVDSTNTDNTDSSTTNMNVSDEKSSGNGGLTSPTTVTSDEPALGETSKPAQPAVEEPKPQSSKSRYKAKKRKNAGATANNAVSKSLANLKANYAAENPLPPSDPKPKQSKSKRSRKSKPNPDSKQPAIVGDMALEPKFGTDRVNAFNGVNASLSKLNTGRNDSSNPTDATFSRSEIDCWRNVPTKPAPAPKSIVANIDQSPRDPKPESGKRESSQPWSTNNASSSNVDWTVTKSQPSQDTSGPSKPQPNLPHSKRRQKRRTPRLGTFGREEYQHPPEIMRLPRHLRPLPPPGWRVKFVEQPKLPDIQPQFAGCEVLEDSDDDAAYGIINIAELEAGGKRKLAEKEKEGWIGDRPAKWWSEKRRREREEDGIFDSDSDTDHDARAYCDWGAEEEGPAKEMEGEGEDWRFMESGAGVEVPT